ncbi:Uncharacterized protein TCAP_05453 [Tolypocladium capitatum]|uniref:Zn(2)-C6 fungal-type domain-containing protein n=1 Tax=Tolypocladium capitatum TaxID=45235 RepID=A0A2K3QAQ8_9HYPO|nr:Uncharacterized protein TCAP_05453 [Tolypocladium capitatum]
MQTHKIEMHEVKPSCGPCNRGSCNCGFPDDTVFRSFERSSTFARSADKSGQDGKLFDDSTVWLQVPDNLVFVHVENPYELDALGSLAQERSTKALSARERSFTERSVTYYVQPEDTMLAPSTTADDDDMMVAALPVPEVPDDVKVFQLQLMRHFRQVSNVWMDTFDTTAFFSSKIPSMATANPLLKSAVCALAAKHLSRTEHSPIANASIRFLSESLARVSQTSTQATWTYQAAQYYDCAIGLFKKAIDLHHFDDDTTDSASLTTVFATAAILSMFELMDAPGDGRRVHLVALPLFNSICTASGFPSSPLAFPRGIVRGPIVWRLVRQDFLCAFISERQTPLNLDDILLWQNAGLAADNNGELLPFSPFNTTDYRASIDILEDARSNELLWLLGKIVNFLTAGDAVNPEDFALPADQRFPLGVTQEQLLDRWSILDMELRKWLGSLPSTFEIKARTGISQDSSSDDQSGPPSLQQVWYELPICSATIQAYHMVRILILTNKPQESTAIRSTLSARFRYYRKVQDAVLWHAREICGISLANPPDSVRLHSVLPLFVAGQVFYNPREQNVVMELLSSIEEDLGWATEHHRERLFTEWAKEHHD